jgi:3-deoxy-manno-octulosonate cytidylyltransferase (CMP-KDO synthetase)
VSTLIVIPARLGATRLPQKPLRDLAGKPLVVRVLERVGSLGIGDEIVVATDSEAVVEAVRAAGGKAVMTRADHPSGTDRVAEVAALPEFRKHAVIVNVQGDEPFVAPEAVRLAAGFVERGEFPIGTAACPDDPAILDEPSVVKVVADRTGRALYFSRAPIPFLRDPADAGTQERLVLRHIGIYAYSRSALERWVSLPPSPLEVTERLEQLRPLADGLAIGVGIAASASGAGIDTEEDLRRANASWPNAVPTVTSPVAAGLR